MPIRRVVIQNDINVHVARGVAGLKEDSTVLLSQIRTIDKTRLDRKIGHLPPSYLKQPALS